MILTGFSKGFSKTADLLSSLFHKDLITLTAGPQERMGNAWIRADHRQQALGHRMESVSIAGEGAPSCDYVRHKYSVMQLRARYTTAEQSLRADFVKCRC